VWTSGCRHRNAVARRVIQQRCQLFWAGDHELRPREFVAQLRVLALERGDGAVTLIGRAGLRASLLRRLELTALARATPVRQVRAVEALSP
jgi:hypothetical protein